MGKRGAVTAKAKTASSDAMNSAVDSIGNASNDMNNSSIVGKLHMIRSFLGDNSGFSESDLSTCLREAGYVVDVAAERLMTGQHQPSSKKAKRMTSPKQNGDPTFSNATAASYSAARTPLPSNVSSVDCDTDLLMSSSSSFPATGSSCHSNINSRSSTDASVMMVTPKSTPGTASRGFPVDETRAVANDRLDRSNDWKGTAWLLCHRWVSDGVNLQRNGSCDYNEYLYVQEPSATSATTEAAAGAVPSRGGAGKATKRTAVPPPSAVNHSSLRFRSSRMQGSFPRYLAPMLNPLLRSNLIRLEARALMEERHLNVGADIAFSLSVWIVDPLKFFALFDGPADPTTTGGGTSTYSKQFLARNINTNNGSPKQGMHLGGNDVATFCHAAFSLLQWAQYGLDYDRFETGTNKENVGGSGDCDGNDDICDNSNSDVDGGDEDDAVIAASQEDDVPGWARQLVDPPNQEQDSEANGGGRQWKEMDPPPSFKAQLRPYQKQALHWMTQREKINADNPESAACMREHLELLKEMVDTTGNTSIDDKSTYSEYPSVGPCRGRKRISCDCGPVRVDTQHVRAPSVSAAFDRECSFTRDSASKVEEAREMLVNPLWQRRFLCNSEQTRALSFFVQPFLQRATARTPPPMSCCRGGILADSMGLGKTVMLLALVDSSKQEDDPPQCDDRTSDIFVGTNKGKCNGTLIVTPLSLLLQWREEIEAKTTLSHYVHYGEHRSSKPGSVIGDVDVVLTTYGSLQAEFQKYREGLKQNSVNVNASAPLLSKLWKRVILDEAHIIKNHATLAAKACFLLQAERRWCVSGTVIQNSLEDVYSLIRFLRHEPWCESGFWKAYVTKLSHLSLALDRVRRVLSPIMLRRTKETLINGKPILNLPAIDLRLVKVEFTNAERQFYDALYRKSFDIFQGFIQAGTASSSWIKIFSLLHRLRQTCCHVALTVKAHLDDDRWMHISQSTLSSRGVLNESESNADGEEDKEEIDPDFLDDLLNKFKTMQADRNGKPDRCAADKNGEEDHATNVAKMLNDAVQAKYVELNEECPICLERIPIEDSVITPCLHLFCQKCLLDALKDNVSSGGGRQKRAQDSPCAQPGTCPVCVDAVDAGKILRISRSQDGKLLTDYLCQSSGHLAPQEDEDGPARATLQIATQGSSSSKLDAIQRELENVWMLKPRSKVIVFSQFLGMLDLLAHRFKCNYIPFERLDGKLSLKERMAVLRRFGAKTHNELPDSDLSSTSLIGSVLLTSMKAGGVGLNLIAASSVFIVDPWWNSAVEDQCVDRIHRIGQTATTIHVRKFYVTNSIEESILKLQKRKKSIASSALCDGSATKAEENGTRATLEDFKILFEEGCDDSSETEE